MLTQTQIMRHTQMIDASTNDTPILIQTQAQIIDADTNTNFGADTHTNAQEYVIHTRTHDIIIGTHIYYTGVFAAPAPPGENNVPSPDHKSFNNTCTNPTNQGRNR